MTRADDFRSMLERLGADTYARIESPRVDWTCGSGRIDLALTVDEASSASHQGQCEDDVDALSRLPHIASQLAAIDPGVLAAELSEYGAWDEPELADHEQNLQRVLWIASGDIIGEDREGAV